MLVAQSSEGLNGMPLPAPIPESFRIEASDPRADNRRRVIDVAREAIAIRRSVQGVAMTIRVASIGYRGVALRISGLEDGRFHYEVKLTHSDPDLSVALAEGHDQRAMETEWRRWVRFFRAPALVGRVHGRDVEVNIDATDLARRLPSARRGGRATAGRRPRFLMRRKTGGVSPTPLEVVQDV
jgi:hypothetical protein